MAAIRRQDGLYDLPELGYSGVPANMVPDHIRTAADDLYNQQATPTPAGPDLRLASNGGGGSGNANANAGSDRFAQYAQPDNAPAPSQVPLERNDWGTEGQGAGRSDVQSYGTAPEQPAAKPSGKLADDVELSAPPKPGETGGKKLDQGDPYLSSFLLAHMHGTPPTVVPEHLAKSAESWTQHDLKAPPGTTTERNELPDDAIPVWRNSKLVFQTVNSGPEMTGWEKGQKVGDVTVAPKPTNVSNWRPEYSAATREVPNDVLTAGARDRANASTDDVEAIAHQNELKAASRSLDVGNVMTDQAARERASVDELQKKQAGEQADYQRAMGEFRASLERINAIAAQKPPEPSLGAKLTLGIAQGLLYAGAAVAGQQVPHVDWIGQQIQLNAQRQREQLEAGVHVAGFQLNALHALRQNASPEAAQHLLAMADYTASMHMVDGMVKENASPEMIAKANLLKAQLAEKRDKEAELATQAEHVSQIQRIPRTVTAGKPGGYEGLRSAAKALFKEPKAQDEAVARWAGQIGRGEMPSMPDSIGGDGMNMRAKETKATNQEHAKLQLDPTITGVSGVAYGGNDEKMVHDAKLAQVQGRAIINSFETLRDEAKRVGSKTVDRTTVAKIDIELQALEAKLLVAAKEGNTESKVEAMKVRSARDYLQKMSVADTNEVINFAEESALGAINSLIPLDQFTRTYRGDDYIRDNTRESKRVRR